MRMIIRYRSGHRFEAVLLTAGSERMRVAIDSQRDTVELHKVGANWRTERGAAIEIEALIQLPGTDLPHSDAVVLDGILRGGWQPPLRPAHHAAQWH